MNENDLVFRLRKRAGIRRSISDRVADLLEEAASEIERLRQFQVIESPSITDEVLTCQDCGTTDGVRNTTCPFASEINGRELEITVCGNCRQKRAEEI